MTDEKQNVSNETKRNEKVERTNNEQKNKQKSQKGKPVGKGKKADRLKGKKADKSNRPTMEIKSLDEYNQGLFVKLKKQGEIKEIQIV